MTKFKKFWSALIQGLGVYICTLLGVLLSQYAPLLLRQGPINTPFQWVRLGISAAMALYIVSSDEGQGDQEAKKANLKRRLHSSFMSGMGWNAIMGIAGQAAGQ
jgi:hypothetical protein